MERLHSYSSLQAETSVLGEAATPEQLAAWPTTGRIDFERVSVRYAPHLPFVLQDVSFTLAGASKLGLIDRTGAGKSTLLQLLFRFLDLDSGQICIDGLNIKHIPLALLRHKISIIPQDPTLFEGSLVLPITSVSELLIVLGTQVLW